MAEMPGSMNASEAATISRAKISRKSPEFRRVTLAMFAAGFATFALMYCVQPLLPVFSKQFGVSAAGASFALSFTTATLAVALLVASALSEALGRKRVMVVSVLGAALLTIVSAAIPGWTAYLAIRAAIGLVMSGVPAVAMGYLAEEMDSDAIGLAMGLFIGGSGFGGMSGRLVTSVLTDAFGWRIALAALGAFCLGSGLVFAASLPPSRHFVRHTLSLRALGATYLGHLADPGLRLLYAEGFLIMGGLVSTYNYISFRLLAPPFSLSQTAVGLIFAVYILGIASSATFGHVAGRFGRRRVLPLAIAIELAGALLTLAQSLPVVILGIALVTIGFFAAHSVASSWVGARARGARAQAAALYLFLYYVGLSLIGSVAGIAWHGYGWGGVVALIAALLLVAVTLAGRLARLPSAAGEVM